MVHNTKIKDKIQGIKRVMQRTDCQDSYNAGESFYQKAPHTIWSLTDFADKKSIDDILDKVCDTAAVNVFVAHDLFWQSPKLMEKIGYSGFEKISDISKIVAKESMRGANNVIWFSPGLIEDLGCYGDHNFVLRVYDICFNMIKQSPIPGLCFLEYSKFHLDMVKGDLTKFEKLANQTLVLFEGSSYHGIKFACGCSNEYNHFVSTGVNNS